MKVKPFLKWAGGKTQLIDQISKNLPEFVQLKTTSFIYVEPFVGSGAILFWLFDNFPNLETAIINDINKDLTDCYKTIKENVNELIIILVKWQEEYYKISAQEDKKKEYYYAKRRHFNLRQSNRLTQSALFIFLNRTCFNGLFRVNSKNEFNVPIGGYKKPLLCDEANLKRVSKILEKVTILNGDYSETLSYARNNTFFYLDPPYKPLSKTSSFNSYTKDVFDDNEQIRLKSFCDELSKADFNWLLSNSDVKQADEKTSFFDDLYKQFQIKRVDAKRIINATASKRGQIKELLIRN